MKLKFQISAIHNENLVAQGPSSPLLSDLMNLFQHFNHQMKVIYMQVLLESETNLFRRQNNVAIRCTCEICGDPLESDVECCEKERKKS